MMKDSARKPQKNWHFEESIFMKASKKGCASSETWKIPLGSVVETKMRIGTKRITHCLQF